MDQSKFFRGVYAVGLLLLACGAGSLFAFAGRTYVVAVAGRHPIMLATAIALACLDIVALVTALQQRQQAPSSSYVAGLIATATLLPGGATLITVVIYLAKIADQFAPLWGAIFAAEAWLGAAYVCRGFAKAEKAVPSSFGELRQRLDQLDAALNAVRPTGFENDLCRTIAYKEAEKQSTEAKKELSQDGPSWVSATGYVNVWERVYRAEEALIEVAPQETVLSGAVYDESRLQGSKIEPRDELLAKLRQAVAVIDPSAGHYLIPPARVMGPLVISPTSPLPEGTVNTAYAQALVATGGMPPFGWKFTDEAEKPNGLELNPTGVLSGTPGLAKTFNFTVRVTDSASQMTDRLFTLTIKDPAASPAPAAQLQALAVSTPSPLPEGSVNKEYTQTLLATGGMPPYRWTATGAPAWLALTETTGELRGTPTEAKTFNFTVRVSDKEGKEEPRDFTLTVYDSARTYASPPCNTDPKRVARAVLRTVRRSINEFRNASWNGLILARNHLLTTMIYTGMTVFVLLAIAMVWGAPRPTVFAASVFYLVGATTGLFDRLRRESQAEVAIEDYGLSTARLVTIPLFSGLGAIGGVLLVAMMPFSSTVLGPRTPTPPGPSPLAISTPSQLTEREVAKAYSETLQATGGTQPYKWTISEGAIPDALVLSPAGVLSGTPTNAGTGNFTARVADSAGVAVEKRFALPIKPPAQQTPLAISTTSPLPGGAVGTAYSERLQATGGQPPYSWKVFEGEKPAGLELDGNTGVLHGAPTQAKTFSFSVQVKDSTDAPADKRNFNIPISQSGQAPPIGAVTKSPPDRSPSEQIPSLVKIFDLGENLIGLLVAAVFGLTPGLLFERLQQQTDKYKADLKSSQATEGAQKT